MGANIGRTTNGFADMLGHAAHVLDALFAKQVHPALQFGDQISLQRIKGDRCKTHQRVLDKDKGRNRDQDTALIKRKGECLAKEAAERFGLGGDH